MTIAYAATGLTQTDATITGNTTNAAATQGATTLGFAALAGVSVGQMITSPAAARGLLVTAVTATQVTTDRPIRANIASGTAITFQDSDAILSGSIGITITNIGSTSLKYQQRIIQLTGSSTSFTVTGTYNIDALRNTYFETKSTNNASFNVTGTLNIAGTDTGYWSDNATTFGPRVFNYPNIAPAQETFTGSLTITNAGNVNINGVEWYSNFGWTAGAGSGGAASGTFTINNSTIRLGTNDAGNAVNTLYNASTQNQAFTFNFNNVYFNGYMKLLAVTGASTFTNVTWFKESPIAPSYGAGDIAICFGPYTSGTTTPNTATTGMNIVGPKFGIAGSQGGYYNTHIAMGFYGGGTSGNRTEGPVAIRNTCYGYEQGVKPLIGKTYDYGSGNAAHRAWLEIRKNLQITVRDTSNNLLGANAMGTYIEDSQLHTGALSHANVANQGSGYTNGSFTSITISGGTSGTVTITVVGGLVSSVSITTAGSGYAFANGVAQGIVGGITFPVNATNFPGVGAGINGSLQLFAYARVTGETNSGCPTATSNVFYTAQTNASGVVNVTSTNSSLLGTLSANPVIPSTATTLTGIDLLLAITNHSFAQAFNSFGLFMTDTRWAANGATSYSVPIALRGYGYNDLSYTYTDAGQTAAEALAQTVMRSLFAAPDTYLVATGISEATAGTYTDVTLVTPAPTRGALAFGDTQGPLIPSTTGTLTTTIARTLDQVYAKAKYDYTRRTLDTTAGTVAHTGFGISSFISSSGAVTNATFLIGSWNAALTGKITQGSVYKTLSTTGNLTLTNPAASAAENGIAINANQISLPLNGAFATWVTTYTPVIASTGVTLTGLSNLSPNINTTVTASADTSTHNIKIAAALQAALPLASTVVAANIAGVAATGLYSGGTFTAFGSTFACTSTWNVPNAAGTASVACTIAPSATWSTLAVALTAVVNALNANTNFTGAGWSASSSGTSITITRSTTGALAFTAFTITGADGNWTGVFTGTWNTSLTNGVTAANTLTFTVPPVVAATTIAPVLGGTAVSSPSNGTITQPISPTNGGTLYQSLTATTYTGVGTTGTILATGGSFNGGSYSVSMTGSITATGGTLTAAQTYSPVNNTQTISFTNVNLSNAITIATPDASTYSLTLTSCTLVGNLNVSRTGTGLVNVIINNLNQSGFAITTSTGVTAVVSQVLTFLGTSSVVNLTDIKIARLWIDGVERTGANIFTFTRDSSNNIIAAVTAGIPITATNFYAMFFIDGFDPVGTNTTPRGQALSLSFSSILASSLDFSTTLGSVDTDVITRSSVSYTASVVSPYSPPIVMVNLPNNAFTTSGNSNLYSPASVGISKLVVRRILELSANTAYHQAIATNAIAGQHIAWTTVGYQVNDGIQSGTETFRFTLQKNAANTASLVIMDLFINSAAYRQFPNQDNYLYSTTTSNVAQSIVVLIKSPGAILQLTSNDQSALASYAVSGIVGTAGSPGPLSKVARGVESTSLLIPTTIAIP